MSEGWFVSVKTFDSKALDQQLVTGVCRLASHRQTLEPRWRAFQKTPQKLRLT